MLGSKLYLKSSKGDRKRLETLEQRKAKYQAHLKKAQAFEEDDELMAAVKEYRQALKYCLHKNDSDQINKKIIRLNNLAGHVSGMLGEGKSSEKSKFWIVITIGLVLLVIVALAIIFIFKPFG